MDPRTSAQDVMRCDLCETVVVQMHCDTCIVNLCTACVGKHMISDESKDHKVVKFQARKSTPLYPRCKSHEKERCEMYCNQCDIPICSACIASETHTGHKILQILPVYYAKKKEIETVNEELKESIYPTYQDIASEVQNRMSTLEKEYGDLSTAITKHGDYWHRELDKIVSILQAQVNEMKATHQGTLEKHITEINQRMSDIDDEIHAFFKLLESNNISEVFEFKRKTTEFRKLPCKVVASIPSFTPLFCQQEQFINMFGNLSTLSITSDKHGYSMKTTQKPPKAGSSPKVKRLFDQPETVTTIDMDKDTWYGHLTNVACLSDEEIWISSGNIMKLYSTNQGSLLKSFKTSSSRKFISDIAVTKSGDLLYTDDARSVNLVKNEKIEQVIIPQNWSPTSICITFSGDLLVIMNKAYGLLDVGNSDAVLPSKVVRYSGSTEKQTIQFDDKSNPLYSPGIYYRYITENRNLDICVSDSAAKAVVVVNQAGKLRFKYTGNTPTPENKPFSPRGITTNSQSHILTADYNNDCVHIIDQDGQFLRYIDCGLSQPFGLCIDTDDNLFVADRGNRQVKKIKHLQ